MKRLILVFVLFSLIGCGSQQRTQQRSVTVGPPSPVIVPPSTDPNPEQPIKETKSSKQVNAIIKTAMSYSGTPYKYGGTTNKGMDCSGLVYTAFKAHQIPLERVSAAMAKQGKKIKLNKVKKGDLLFFTTNKNSRRINHVGLVVSTKGGDIQFIHATTSRGVLVSSLKEGYWNYAFDHARTVL